LSDFLKDYKDKTIRSENEK